MQLKRGVLLKCSRDISTTNASISSEVPKTEKLVKARHRRRSAFIVSRSLKPLIKYEARIVDILCISQFQLRPSLPGQLRGICTHCQSRGSGISEPQGYPWAFNTTWFLTRDPNVDDFDRERSVDCHRLACPSRIGQNCGGF